MADETPAPELPGGDQSTEPKGKTMTVKVYAPFQVYYEGDARGVSAVNDVGPFDVLPGHHNFLCMLVPCDLQVQLVDKSVKTIKINRALLHVHSNHVTVFVDV